MSDDIVTVELELERGLLDKIESRSTAGRYGFEPQAQSVDDTGVSVTIDSETAEAVSRRGLDAASTIEWVTYCLAQNQLSRLTPR